MSRSLSLLRSSSERVLRVRSGQCVCSVDQVSRLDNRAGTSRAASRRFLGTATVTARRSEDDGRAVYLDDEELDAPSSGQRRSVSRNGEGRPERVPYPKYRPKADPAPMVDYLQRLLPPLEFPPNVATQMLTHISAAEAWAGHNARFAFIGRRVLHTYLLLFLHHASSGLSPTGAPALTSNAVDFDRIAYRALFTPLLGEHVGNAWALARATLWTPPTPRAPLSRRFVEERTAGSVSSGAVPGAGSPGLYKVQGTTVEGVMGGVFHQFGGVVAQRVFHTRVLPNMLLPGTPFGLHDAFHDAAREAQARMGGADGLLVTPAEEATSTVSPSSRTRDSGLSGSMFSDRGAEDRDEDERGRVSRFGRGSQALASKRMALS